MGAIPTRPVQVRPRGPVHGRLAAPSSKSMTNRALVLAALADGASTVRDPLDSDDSAAMRRIVEGLGARVRAEPGAWTVTGTEGRLAVPGEPLDAGLSGTTMRFGLALATLAPGPVTLTGAAPLLRRPVGPLADALRSLGAQVTDSDGLPPVTTAGGGLAGGAVTVDVTTSSQYASAVLLAAPYARDDVELSLHGPAAHAYVRLTVDAMRARGARVDERERGWRVAAGIGYQPGEWTIEHDASAACHLYALAAATGGTLTVTNAAATGQPDGGFPEVLARMGVQVTRTDGGVSVTGPPTLQPLCADLEAMPDQVTTLAVLCALADGTSELRGVGVARGHETDRLAALAAELGKLGVGVEQGPGELVVHGGAPRGPARLRTYDDHRLAMAFAALAARVPQVTICEPGCVRKTYPGFWSDVAALGIDWQEEDPR